MPAPRGVAVIGATGVLGQHTIPRLLERGHRVHALVRDQTAKDRLAHAGVMVTLGDMLHPETLAPALKGCDTVLHLATAVPKPGEPLDWSRDRIRREGTQHLVAACEASGIRRYLQQSIAMLQRRRDDGWADETIAPTLTRVTASAWDMEEIVRASHLDWLILRGARRGTLTLPGEGQAFVSLIHVADMAEAIVQSLDGPAGSVLAVVDDRPVRYAELFDHLLALEGGVPPRTGRPEILASFRVPNRALKMATDWTPHYRSILSGLT